MSPISRGWECTQGCSLNESAKERTVDTYGKNSHKGKLAFHWKKSPDAKREGSKMFTGHKEKDFPLKPQAGIKENLIERLDLRMITKLGFKHNRTPSAIKDKIGSPSEKDIIH